MSKFLGAANDTMEHSAWRLICKSVAANGCSGLPSEAIGLGNGLQGRGRGNVGPSEVLEAVVTAGWPYALTLVTAFGAATLLPVPSEIVLAAQIRAGSANVSGLVAAATVGNVGGALFNWWIGRSLRRFEARPWFPFAPEAIARASALFQRWGSWTLLFSWLPVVGDPLTLVAGVLRVPLVAFIPLVTIGKAARYVALAAGLDAI